MPSASRSSGRSGSGSWGVSRDFEPAPARRRHQWVRTPDTAAALDKLVERFAPLAEASHDLAGQADRLYKLAVRLIETCEKACDAKSSDTWSSRGITRARKAADEARQDLTKQDDSKSVHAWGQLRKVRYFWRQARWLTERFPGAEASGRRRTGQAGGPRRDRSQRLEPDTGALRGRRSGGGGRGLRFRGGDARGFTRCWRSSMRKPSSWRRPSGQTSRSWGYEGARGLRRHHQA